MRSIALVTIIAAIAVAGCRREAPQYEPYKLGANFAAEQQR